jgi:hypothetical protein
VSYISCSHCGVQFLGSPNQRALAGKGKNVYCSPICSRAAGEKRKPVKEYGPCPQCGQMFVSNRPKLHCSMKCHTSSPAFLTRIRAQAKTALAASVIKRTGLPPQPHARIACLECGVVFEEKPSKKSKFCCKQHYRAYMEKRFDRWIASPQAIALPQAYDEFMLQEELPCLIDGCTWSGRSLGMHMNTAHGITARDFKKAAGFNLGTGLVAPEVAQRLSERPHLHIPKPWWANASGPQAPRPEINYKSLEGREHNIKSRAIANAATERTGLCLRCDKHFKYISASGRKLYCSVECRTLDRADKNKTKSIPFVCGQCRQPFLGTPYQELRHSRGNKVFCCTRCRQINNSRRVEGKWLKK